MLNQILKRIKDKHLIFISNYGDDSVAMIQWAKKIGLPVNQIKIVSVDTGFSSKAWKIRVREGERYAQNLGFETITLVSKISFEEATKGRNEFPSSKFQWCSALLKGLPLLDWLDEIDRNCQSIIAIAKRKDVLPALQNNLSEWIEKSPHFNDRSVWHPILNLDTLSRDTLLSDADFIPLNYPSQECFPCVNASVQTLAHLPSEEINRVDQLEIEIKTSMFKLENFEEFESKQFKSKKLEICLEDNSCENSIHTIVKCAKQYQRIINIDFVNSEKKEYSLFYRGCGNHFGCGI